MKKQLILVGGAMGVGKSAVCRELLRQLTPGVWLDGDWCWNMNLLSFRKKTNGWCCPISRICSEPI